MPKNLTPHSRRLRKETAAKWNAKKREAGYRRVSVMISPHGLERLKRQSEIHGNQSAAVEAALEISEQKNEEQND